MSAPRAVERGAALFWIAVAAAAYAVVAGIDAQRDAAEANAVAPSQPAAEHASEHTVEPPPAELEDRYSIFSEQGIHAGVSAF